MAVVIVAAVAANGVIGRGGGLPWYLPDDLRHFKEVTLGGTLVMGRRTYESIGRPLPGRETIVVTRRADWSEEGVEVAHSLGEALAAAADRGGDVFVVGGGEIYAQAVPFADVMELTEIHDEPEGDTYFPSVDWSEWRQTRREEHDGYAFARYQRVGD